MGLDCAVGSPPQSPSDEHLHRMMHVPLGECSTQPTRDVPLQHMPTAHVCSCMSAAPCMQRTDTKTRFVMLSRASALRLRTVELA